MLAEKNVSKKEHVVKIKKKVMKEEECYRELKKRKKE